MAQGGSTTQQGNGLAIAGLVCGVVDLIIFGVLVAVAADDGGFFSVQIG